VPPSFPPRSHGFLDPQTLPLCQRSFNPSTQRCILFFIAPFLAFSGKETTALRERHRSKAVCLLLGPAPSAGCFSPFPRLLKLALTIAVSQHCDRFIQLRPVSRHYLVFFFASFSHGFLEPASSLKTFRSFPAPVFSLLFFCDVLPPVFRAYPEAPIFPCRRDVGSGHPFRGSDFRLSGKFFHMACLSMNGSFVRFMPTFFRALMGISRPFPSQRRELDLIPFCIFVSFFLSPTCGPTE